MRAVAVAWRPNEQTRGGHTHAEYERTGGAGDRAAADGGIGRRTALSGTGGPRRETPRLPGLLAAVTP